MRVPNGSDMDAYSDAYHKKQAETQQSEFSAWVCGLGADPEKRTIHIPISILDDVSVAILTNDQIAEFYNTYPDILQYGTNPNPISFEISTRPTKDNTKMLITGVSTPVKTVEPDITNVMPVNIHTDATTITQTIRNEVWRHSFSPSNPPKVPVKTTVKNNELQVHTTWKTFNQTWEYSSPQHLDTETQVLIEKVGNGDPRFIEGSNVYILPRDACQNKDVINFTEGWGLVPQTLYDKWNTHSPIKRFLPW